MTPAHTKPLPQQEFRQAFGQLLNAFEHYKSENDQRLNSIEKKKAVDPLVDEKIARIAKEINAYQERIDTLTADRQRFGFAQTNAVQDQQLEQKSLLHAYMRDGHTAKLESKAASVGTTSSGGYLIPTSVEGNIINAIKDQSVMRTISNVVTSSSSSYRLAVSQGDESVGWVAEDGARMETASPTLDAIDITAFDLYAMPAATQTLLDDSPISVENWLVAEVQNAFGEQENDAFVNGDGLAKPKGFLDYTQTEETTHSWGNVGYVVTGTSGDFDATNPMDSLLDLIHTPKASYRQNGRFILNKNTLNAVRKLKDNDGNYLWQPARAAGEESSLMGYPVTELDSMPDISSDSTAIAFGDFSRFYTIFDRQGVSILRDPYSNKPYVLFYVVRRVGGGVVDFNAVKLLKFGTS